LLRKFKLLNEKREKICFPFVNFVLSHALEGNTLAIPEVQLAVAGDPLPWLVSPPATENILTPFNPIGV